MRNTVPIILITGLIIGSLGLAGCQTEQGHRALVGGGIGAAGGAAVGAISGGSPLTGALLGGAAGAAIGAITTEDDHHRHYHRY
ncbi:MAG: hypothetical protein GC191_19200 [Azospirillum sp.]|nr:hypothetical protein [Azospirillum sp.]